MKPPSVQLAETPNNVHLQTGIEEKKGDNETEPGIHFMTKQDVVGRVDTKESKQSKITSTHGNPLNSKTFNEGTYESNNLDVSIDKDKRSFDGVNKIEFTNPYIQGEDTKINLILAEDGFDNRPQQSNGDEAIGNSGFVGELDSKN